MKHKMSLDNDPFNSIKAGTKTIELRLNDEKRKLLKAKDLIEFTNRDTLEKLLVEIEDLYKYSDFEELYRHFDKILMGYMKKISLIQVIWRNTIQKKSNKNMEYWVSK